MTDDDDKGFEIADDPFEDVPDGMTAIPISKKDRDALEEAMKKAGIEQGEEFASDQIPDDIKEMLADLIRKSLGEPGDRFSGQPAHAMGHPTLTSLQHDTHMRLFRQANEFLSDDWTYSPKKVIEFLEDINSQDEEHLHPQDRFYLNFGMSAMHNTLEHPIVVPQTMLPMVGCMAMEAIMEKGEQAVQEFIRQLKSNDDFATDTEVKAAEFLEDKLAGFAAAVFSEGMFHGSFGYTSGKTCIIGPHVQDSELADFMTSLDDGTQP